MQKQPNGFTLVEMLIVITIIGLLASLAFPAYNQAILASQRAQAGAMVNDMRTALTAYNTEYGTWPYDTGSGGGTGPSATTLSPTAAYTMFSGDLLQTLTGTNCANPRQIVFLQPQQKDLDNPKTPTKIVTPWKIGSVPTDYIIEVDGNYSNQLDSIPDTTSQDGSGTLTLNAGCAVWCTGAPVKGLVNSDTRKFIHSW